LFYSNPYHSTARPGTAAVTSVAKAPVSNDFDPIQLENLQMDLQPVRDCLLRLVEALKSVNLSAVDSRQLVEGEKAVAVLLKRLARGTVGQDVGEKVLSMTTAINNHDFRSALSIQTGLVNSDWRDHKDWLKGIKALIQLASKKF